jgi:hypothetical protein
MQLPLLGVVLFAFTQTVTAQSVDTSEVDTRSTVALMGASMLTTPDGSFPAVRVEETVRAAPVIGADRAETSSGGEFAFAIQHYPWSWGGVWLELGYRVTTLAYRGDSLAQPTWLGANYLTIGAGAEGAVDVGSKGRGLGFLRLFATAGFTFGGAGANKLETTRYRDTAGPGEPATGAFGDGGASPLSGQTWFVGGVGALIGVGGPVGIRLDARYDIGLSDIFNDVGGEVESPRTRILSLRAGIALIIGGENGDATAE